MGKLGVVGVVLAAFLAGCGGGKTWISRVEEPVYVPPPPEHLLRRPADFRIHDVHVRKEFHYYFYADENINEEVVTVIDYAKPGPERDPRIATLEEYEYAMSLLQEMWKSQGPPDKLKYFNLRHSEQKARSATLLDQRIRFKEAALAQLTEEKEDLEADYESRKETGTFAAGDEKLSLAPAPAVEREIGIKRALIAETQVQIYILEYNRALRDAQYARRGMPVFVMQAVRVGDLVPDAWGPEELIALVKENVASDSWSHADASIEYASQGNLVIKQTRSVIREIRKYIDRLRKEHEAQVQASQQ